MFQAIARFFRATALWVLILPYLFTYAGAASNQLVLIANHDKFPVMLNEVKRVKFTPDANGQIDEVHCVMTSATHLNLLADIFDLHDGIYSVGDGLLEIGSWLEGFCIFVWMALVVKSLNRKATV